MIKNIKNWFYINLYQDESRESKISVLNLTSLVLIVASLLVQIIETDKHIFQKYSDFFYVFDLILVYFFSAEFILRFWSFGINEEYSGIKGRWRYLKTKRTMVDLITLLPFFITLPNSEQRHPHEHLLKQTFYLSGKMCSICNIMLYQRYVHTLKKNYYF